MNWTRRQVDAIRSLSGRRVVEWLAEEVAVRECGAGGLPQWFDPCVPALQLGRLDIVFDDGLVARIGTCQHGDRFGLCRLGELPPLEPSSADAGIYRTRRLVELPSGRIDRVDVAAHEELLIQSVSFEIGGRRLLLRAGEVEEQPDGTLRIVEMDESILVQLDGARPN